MDSHFYVWFVGLLSAAVMFEAFLLIALHLERRGRKSLERIVQAVSARSIHASEEERKHLARELHDDIGQRLSVFAIELDLLKVDPAQFNGRNHSVLDETIAGLKEVAADIHDLSHRLHSYRLEHLGLPAALNEACQKIRTNHKVAIKLELPDSFPPLQGDIALCFYRVAQEALMNVVKHSRSSTVDVELWIDSGEVRLTIKDYGVGFDSTIVANGLGLVTMNERLRLVRGRLRVDSKAGRGTKIMAEAPWLHKEPPQSSGIASAHRAS